MYLIPVEIINKVLSIIIDSLIKKGINISGNNSMQSEIRKAIEDAATDFHENYKNKSIASALVTNTRFYDLESIQDAVKEIIKHPFNPIPRVIIEEEFKMVLPERLKPLSGEAANEYLEYLQKRLIGIKGLEGTLGQIINYRNMKASEKSAEVQNELVGISSQTLDVMKKISEQENLKEKPVDIKKVRDDYLNKFIEKYSAPPGGFIDLGSYEALPIRLQSSKTEHANKSKFVSGRSLSESIDFFNGKVDPDYLENIKDEQEYFYDDYSPLWGETETGFPFISNSNKTYYSFRDIIPLPNKFILTGPQGAGKTTLLHREALEIANYSLQNKDLPIPVIISLLEWKNTDSFAAFLEKLRCDHLKPLWRLLNLYGDLQDLIVSNKIILYLDGLEELEQQQLLEIKEIVIELDCQVIMSFRTESYGDQVNLGFPEIAIQPLQVEDIRRFAISRLGDEKGNEFVNSVRVWEERYQDIRDKDLLILANLPFFLVMMISHYENEGRKHISNRWLLMDYIVARLWKNTLQTKKGIDKSEIKPYEDCKVLLLKLSEISLQNLTTKSISRDSLLNHVPKTVIYALSECGLIYEESQIIHFRHGIFQDFFAAHVLINCDLEPFVHSSIFIGLLLILANYDENQRRRVQTAIIQKLISRENKIAYDNTHNLLWILGEIGDKEAAIFLLNSDLTNKTKSNPIIKTIGKIANHLVDGDPFKEQIIESIGHIFIEEPNIAQGDPLATLWSQGMRFSEMLEKLSQYTDAAKVLAEIQCETSAKFLIIGYQNFMRWFRSKEAPGITDMFRREFLLAISKIGRVAIPLLFDLIWNEDPLNSITAAEALSNMWITLPVLRIVPILVKHPIPLVRAHAALALGDSHDNQGIPFLKDALKDNGFIVYGSAGPYQGGVNQVYFYVSDVVAYALAQFQTDDCCIALRNYGYTEDGLISLVLLLERIRNGYDVSPKNNLRRQWVRYAANYEGGITALLSCLGHIERPTDSPCPIAIGLLDRKRIGKQPTDQIIDFINESKDNVSRKEAILLLAEMGDLQVEPYIRHLISSDKNNAVRITAVGALMVLVSRFSESVLSNNKLVIEDIIKSTLFLKDLEGASGLGRGLAEVSHNISIGKADKEYKSLLNSVATIAINLIKNSDIFMKKTGIVILQEVFARVFAYRFENPFSPEIELFFEKCPSLLIRNAINNLERIRYLDVNLDDPPLEDKEGGFPRRQFFIQESLETINILKQAQEFKLNPSDDWPKDFSEEDWDELGCDEGTICYLIGKTSNYLIKTNDAKHFFHQCVNYYHAKPKVNKEQKERWAKALLSLYSIEKNEDIPFVKISLYLKHAIEISRSLDNPTIRLDALFAYAIASREKEEWKILIQICDEVIGITQMNPRFRINYILAFVMKGQAYIKLNDLDSALIELNKANDFAIKYSLLESNIQIRSWLAIIFALSDNSKFLEEMQIITDYYNTAENWEAGADTIISIASEGFQEESPLKAILYQQGLEFLEKSDKNTDPFKIIYTLRKFTEICIKFQKEDEAKLIYDHWLNIAEHRNYKEAKAAILSDYAYLLAYMKNNKEAEQKALEAMQLLGPSNEMTQKVYETFLLVRENPLWKMATHVIWNLLQSCLNALVYTPKELAEARNYVNEFFEFTNGGDNPNEKELAQSLIALLEGKNFILCDNNPYNDAYQALLESLERTHKLPDWNSALFLSAVEFSRTSDPDIGFTILMSSPELMENKGKEIFTVLLNNAKSLRNEKEAECIQFGLALQKLCQERGVDLVLNRLSKIPRIRQALTDLNNAHSSQILRSTMNEYPELLSQETDEILELEIRVAEIGEETRLLSYLNYNRCLLQSLRARGLDNTVNEMEHSFAILRPLFEYMAENSDEKARGIIEFHPEILTEEAELFLEEWSKLPEVMGVFNASKVEFKRWIILRACRELGTKVAYEDILPIINTVDAFWELAISKNNKTKIREILEYYPVLLSDRIDQYFELTFKIYAAEKDHMIYEQVLSWHDFLVICRKLGIEKALERL